MVSVYIQATTCNTIWHKQFTNSTVWLHPVANEISAFLKASENVKNKLDSVQSKTTFYSSRIITSKAPQPLYCYRHLDEKAYPVLECYRSSWEDPRSKFKSLCTCHCFWSEDHLRKWSTWFGSKWLKNISGIIVLKLLNYLYSVFDLPTVILGRQQKLLMVHFHHMMDPSSIYRWT